MREQKGVPYPLVKPRASAAQHTHDDIEDDERIYQPSRMPRSAIRYTTQGEQVIQQGNRRIIIHNEPPPKRNIHWLLLIGIGMIVMLLLWIGLQMLSNWWTNHQLDSIYGYPRTFQTDQVVGHGDSTDHPTHFIFENLKGHVVIIEIPGGQTSRARIYSGPTLYSDNADSIPVTGEFKDVNNDGMVDMVVVIQDQRIVYLNDGTQFKPQE